MGDHRGRRRASRRDSGARTIASPHVTGLGRRRGDPGERRRGRLISSVPGLVGVAALVVAGLGAVTVTERSTPSAHPAAYADLSGTDAIDSVRTSRPREASRDSARQALAAATSRRVQAATERQVHQRSASLAKIAAAAEKQAREIRLNRWILPTSGYHLTARFGEVSGLWHTVHTGLDFASPTGTPIHAIATGTIVSASYDGSYGNKTVERLADGTEIWYCHQNAFAVSAGDTVAQGEVIGYVGSTGNTTGPHLHLEVHPGGGDPVDPYAALVAHGVTP